MTKKALTVLAFGLSAIFVAPAAIANPLNFGGKAAAAAPTSAPTSLEVDMAESKVSTTHKKLDQAKQQLEAAKAHLKAADAEFKAALADKQALVLRTKARELASASGLEQTGDSVSGPAKDEAPAPGANRIDLAPVEGSATGNAAATGATSAAPATSHASAPTLQDLAP